MTAPTAAPLCICGDERGSHQVEVKQVNHPTASATAFTLGRCLAWRGDGVCTCTRYIPEQTE